VLHHEINDAIISSFHFKTILAWRKGKIEAGILKGFFFCHCYCGFPPTTDSLRPVTLYYRLYLDEMES